jgi:hypothetical protein
MYFRNSGTLQLQIPTGTIDKALIKDAILIYSSLDFKSPLLNNKFVTPAGYVDDFNVSGNVLYAIAGKRGC